MTTPAGWYPDPEHRGRQRYWDGAAWTEHRAPLYPTVPQQPRPGSRFGRRKVLTGLGAAFLAVLLIGSFGTAETTTTVVPASGSPEGDRTPEPTPTPAAEATEKDRSRSEEPANPGPTASSTPEKNSPTPPKRTVKRYRVLDVIDGDTVEVGYRGTTSVRIIGIDTPETVSPSTPDECYGAKASAAATRILQGRQVELVFDPSQGRTDKYGRTLAYLRIPGRGDFGLAMIRRGYAAEYTYDTAYRHQRRYLAAEQRAGAANRGMWGACGGPDTPLHKPDPAPNPSEPSGNCEPGYNPCVPVYPPDVDCADVQGPITVTGSDPHGLDGEGDGIACEPY